MVQRFRGAWKKSTVNPFAPQPETGWPHTFICVDYITMQTFPINWQQSTTEWQELRVHQRISSVNQYGIRQLWSPERGRNRTSRYTADCWDRHGYCTITPVWRSGQGCHKVGRAAHDALVMFKASFSAPKLMHTKNQQIFCLVAIISFPTNCCWKCRRSKQLSRYLYHCSLVVASVHLAAKNAKFVFCLNGSLSPCNVSTPFFNTTVLFVMVRTFRGLEAFYIALCHVNLIRNYYYYYDHYYYYLHPSCF